jgi:hypothetical protein
MQQLTIRAANHLTAQDLYSTLAAFHPELITDDEAAASSRSTSAATDRCSRCSTRSRDL